MKGRLFVGLLACAFVLSLSCKPSAGEYVIRFGGAQLAGHPLTELQFKFKELAEKYSNGQIEVKVYYASQLGGVSEVNAAARDGSITMSMSSITYIVGNYNPKYAITTLPYLITRSNEQKLFDIMNGDIGDRFSKEMEKHNFKILGYYRIGFRNITNNKRPIYRPDDLKGLKIRLQPNQVHINAMRALGANPLGMDWAEVYSALQQGVIDGQENPLDIIYTNKFYEVQKYCTLTEHFFDIGGVYMNLPYFNKLPENLQEAVLRAGNEAMLFERELSAGRESEFLAKLKRKMEVIELTQEGLREFKEKSKPVYDQVKGIVMDDELVDEFLNHFR